MATDNPMIELFDWREWTVKQGYVIYEDVTLKVPIGPLKPGQSFKIAEVNMITNQLKFYNTEDDAVCFSLSYVIEDQLFP